MKWIYAYDKYMPPRDSGLLLLKVLIHPELKNIKHNNHPMEVAIECYVLEHADYDCEKFSLEKARIYNIEMACCTGLDDEDEILAKNKINVRTIKDLVSPEEWHWKMSDIWEWISLYDIKDADMD